MRIFCEKCGASYEFDEPQSTAVAIGPSHVDCEHVFKVAPKRQPDNEHAKKHEPLSSSSVDSGFTSPTNRTSLGIDEVLGHPKNPSVGTRSKSDLDYFEDDVHTPTVDSSRSSAPRWIALAFLAILIAVAISQKDKIISFFGMGDLLPAEVDFEQGPQWGTEPKPPLQDPEPPPIDRSQDEGSFDSERPGLDKERSNVPALPSVSNSSANTKTNTASGSPDTHPSKVKPLPLNHLTYERLRKASVQASAPAQPPPSPNNLSVATKKPDPAIVKGGTTNQESAKKTRADSKPSQRTRISSKNKTVQTNKPRRNKPPKPKRSAYEELVESSRNYSDAHLREVDFRSYMRRARAALAGRKYQQARTQFEQALKAHPDSLEPIEGLGEVALASDNVSLSLEYFRSAAQKGYPNAYYKLGVAYERLEQSQEALSAYSTYLKIRPGGRYGYISRTAIERIKASLNTLPEPNHSN